MFISHSSFHNINWIVLVVITVGGGHISWVFTMRDFTVMSFLQLQCKCVCMHLCVNAYALNAVADFQHSNLHIISIATEIFHTVGTVEYRRLRREGSQEIWGILCIEGWCKIFVNFHSIVLSLVSQSRCLWLSLGGQNLAAYKLNMAASLVGIRGWSV